MFFMLMLADLYRLPRSMSTPYKNGECIMIYYFLYPHFLGGFALSEVTNAGQLVKSIAILAIVRVVFFIIILLTQHYCGKYLISELR